MILEGTFENKPVRLRGWLHNRRSSGGIQFILLRDGSGTLQCTIKKDAVDKETFDIFDTVPPESTIQIEGIAKKDSRAPGGYEVSIEKASVYRAAEENFPIAQKYHGPEFLLDNRHLWIRNRKMQATLRIRASVLEAAREWFRENRYTEAHVPTIITAACEGGSTLFEVKYFDTKAYLTQSWQLYAEAMIASLGRIYTIAPSFRAERSRTRRHLTEYWHLEAEAPWYNLDSLMKDEEELLTHIVHSVARSRPNELKLNKREPADMLKLSSPFPRITYDKAVQLLKESGVDIKYGEDLGWEQERILTLKFDTPFFVTYFPKTCKAFYHKLDPSDPKLTLSADLLAPEGYGEITGGGERIDDLNELTQRIREENLDPKSYQWYLDLRRFGSVPHAGFGLGVERTIAWICKLKHIRDATAFPRLINRVYP
jgi:asparaginyl-tRNA synthetase